MNRIHRSVAQTSIALGGRIEHIDTAHCGDPSQPVPSQSQVAGSNPNLKATAVTNQAVTTARRSGPILDHAQEGSREFLDYQEFLRPSAERNAAYADHQSRAVATSLRYQAPIRGTPYSSGVSSFRATTTAVYYPFQESQSGWNAPPIAHDDISQPIPPPHPLPSDLHFSDPRTPPNFDQASLAALSASAHTPVSLCDVRDQPMRRDLFGPTNKGFAAPPREDIARFN